MGLNWIPVATWEEIAAGDAETTVSAKPPVEETTGSVPYRKPYNCVSPQGSKREGTRIASAPAIIRCESFSSYPIKTDTLGWGIFLNSFSSQLSPLPNKMS